MTRASTTSTSGSRTPPPPSPRSWLLAACGHTALYLENSESFEVEVVVEA